MTNEEATALGFKIQDEMRGLAGYQLTTLQMLLGQAAVAQASLGVRKGVDPYGRAWKPVRSRPGGQPLRRTGNNIQRGWHASPAGRAAFKFGSFFKYIATHQYGAVIVPVRAKALRFQVEGAPIFGLGRGGAVKQVGAEMNTVFARSVTIPRRQLVPEADTGGLGQRWQRSFNRTIRKYLLAQFELTHAMVGQVS